MKLAQEYGKLYLAEDPFTETAPTVPSKPNKNDYSLGEDDPAYIEAYNTYTNAANSGKTQTGNPNVPKTGGGVAVSLFALAATAGLAGGAVLLKKKIENSKD